MKMACLQWLMEPDRNSEIEDMRISIQSISKDTDVDARFILANILQESMECVRAPTSFGSHDNPGLMQSYMGTGGCNSGSVAQTPCPLTEIRQMILDGTNGTSSGPGLVQNLASQDHIQDPAQVFYRAARIYNGGSIKDESTLELTEGTSSYVSDLANRLTGWAYAPSNFHM